MVLALGIDGGGTHTRCLVVDESGQMIGYAVSDASKPDAVDLQIGRANLHQAIREACQSCGTSAIDSIFVGMGGISAPSDVEVVRGMLSGLDLKPTASIGIDHDVRVALAGGTAGAPGIALIVGTGSSCYGRNAAGESWRSGGWGFIMDDYGSGFYLGQQALEAVIRAYDGRGAATALTAPVLEALGLDDVLGLMHCIYFPTLNFGGIASLARIVVSVADHDAVARAIVDRGCAELALMVKATADHLRLRDSFPVVPVGGLASSGWYREILTAAIRDAVPGAQVKTPLAAPVVGAALLAFEQIGVMLSPAALAQVESALPQ